jgi:hypothetical protein
MSKANGSSRVARYAPVGDMPFNDAITLCSRKNGVSGFVHVTHRPLQ